MNTFETELHYCGIFANADSSILHLKVPGFEIKTASGDELKDLFNGIERGSRDEFLGNLYTDTPCFNFEERCFFIITKRSRGIVSINEYGGLSGLDPTLSHDFEVVNKTIKPLVNGLRLFGEGNLGLAVGLHYFFHEGWPRRIAEVQTSRFDGRFPYKIEQADMHKLTEFLATTQIPLSNPILELARDYYDRSYQANGRGMGFLMLMTGMEVLFNRGKDQITYTISRYPAVLLGKTESQSREIFQRMKKLYGIRSNIVHKGDAEDANDASVRELRGFLRESIKALLRLGLNKEDYCSKLDALGFGQPPI